MANQLVTTLSALGIALAPALLKFAEVSGSDATELEVNEDAAVLCVSDPDAPVHARYKGSNDIDAHLAEGAVVQVLSKRKTWRHVAYVSDGQAELGWLTESHLEECPEAPTTPTATSTTPVPLPTTPPSAGSAGAGPGTGACGQELAVTFYDVGQALSALVQLPDGRRVLVDAGEQATRAGCGGPCNEWSQHLLGKLGADIPNKKLDLLWITHQHSDHAGNAPGILNGFQVGTYADNGTNLDSGIIKKARKAATERNVTVHVVDPNHRESPIADGGGVRFRPVLPSQWITECEDDPNDCSIGLRIDYCQSSLLFVGDAEDTEEEALDTGGPVTLLQVGHHGSDTSSSEAFVQRIQPKYAVVSSGKPAEGTNTGYCHPRLSTVEELTRVIGGPTTRTIDAFDAEVSCKQAQPANWHTVKVSDRVWFTARDDDVKLVTRGDGVFERR